MGAGAAEQQQVGLEDAVLAGRAVGRDHRVGAGLHRLTVCTEPERGTNGIRVNVTPQRRFEDSDGKLNTTDTNFHYLSSFYVFDI